MTRSEKRLKERMQEERKYLSWRFTTASLFIKPTKFSDRTTTMVRKYHPKAGRLLGIR